MLPRPDIAHILRAAENIAAAKLCAWREKDRDWLRVAFQTGIANAKRVAALVRTDLPDTAPAVDELERRLVGLVSA